ncbi:helix-turn-helix transcriptional regulator [Lacticaseibacillus daqingensis]|uniref:helix-turn-helix transcriptional regulator n=1 Tax=Lacticaseibacillus daqingensis TaxID=2486014 RepID=UPI000F77088E|nr:helix-turn-helix domain-containing protein [Lacticaseibacillus daqingensis]
MVKTITLPVPDEYEQGLKQEMRAAAVEAFRSAAGRHRWAEYLQRKDAAEMIGVSVSTLDKLTAQGMPCVVIDGLKLWRRASVDQWLLKHEM